jgi:glycosyltransferase involved in cell wall biosynthesis
MAYGGAEWVTQVICQETFPGSLLVYLAGLPELAERMSPGEKRRLLSPLYNKATYRALLPTYPSALRRLPVLPGNLIASSYAFVNGLQCEGKKVVYCHSPFRQAWSGAASYGSGGSLGERLGLRLVGERLRMHDAAAARTADLYVASSNAVEKRVKEFYGIDRVLIIPPPVDVDVFHQRMVPRGDYFLWVGRIVEPYKRLSLLMETFAEDSRYRLVVVGDGRSRRALESRAPRNVEFIGWQSPSNLATLYSGARAVIFPSEDDFGIVPLEAMACGSPVIAFRGGGALDTVVEDESGIFFDEASVQSLRAALDRFERATWKEDDISRYVMERYSPRSFSAAITHAVEAL